MPGITDSYFRNLKRSHAYFFLPFLLIALSACGVRNANIDPGEPVQIAQFTAKRVAVLPVHGDNSIGTDSQLQLKRAINLKLDKKIKSLLRNSTIIDSPETTKILNRNSLLAILNKLYIPYRSVGVFDEKLIKKLFNKLDCDYLVISDLKHETVDFVAANVYLLSLDVLIVNRNDEIVWTGTGDFKQGGMFGAGRVSNQQGAQEIVELAFSYWKPAYASQGHRTALNQQRTGYQPSRRNIDPKVQSVQQILLEKHYNPGPADGLMGKKTRRALKAFQRDNALKVTGTLNDETYKKLTNNELSLSESNLPMPALPTNDTTVKKGQEKPSEHPIAGPGQQTSGKYTTTDSADLLEEEDLYGANVIVTIPRNTVLNIISSDGEYYKVRYKGKEGYVHTDYVKKNNR